MRVIAVVVMSALTSLVLELASCVWLRRQGYASLAGRPRHLLDPFRGHRLNPEYQGFDSGGARLHSAQGFRAAAMFSPTKTPGTYRIILAGASTAYGLGSSAPYPSHPALDAAETLDAQLARTLEPRLDTKVEVINAAVPAYWVFQQVVYVDESLLAYEPDLILFVEGHNDFFRVETSRGPWRSYTYSSPLWVEGLNQRGAPFTALVLIRYLARFSWFFSGLEARVTALFEASARRDHPDLNLLTDGSVALPDRDTFRRIARDNVGRHYLQVAILGRMYGYRTAVVLQPELVLEDPVSLGPEDRRLQDMTLRLTGMTPERRAALEGYVPLIAEAVADAGKLAGDGLLVVDHHSLAPDEGVGDDALYYDYCHLSPHGTRRLAERIADDLALAVSSKREAR